MLQPSLSDKSFAYWYLTYFLMVTWLSFRISKYPLCIFDRTCNGFLDPLSHGSHTFQNPNPAAAAASLRAILSTWLGKPLKSLKGILARLVCQRGLQTMVEFLQQVCLCRSSNHDDEEDAMNSLSEISNLPRLQRSFVKTFIFQGFMLQSGIQTDTHNHHSHSTKQGQTQQQTFCRAKRDSAIQFLHPERQFIRVESVFQLPILMEEIIDQNL